MNPSKKKLMIGLGVFALLFVAAAAFLVIRRGALGEARDSLDSELQTRGSLASAKVFPSSANLQKLEEQRKALQQILDDTRSAVSNRQVQAVAVTGTKFNDLLESTRKSLAANAARKKVLVNATEVESPENLAPVDITQILPLDLKEYDAVSPKEENAPRLTIQMKTLEQVVNALIDAGVNAIVSCRREKFDVPIAATSGSLETTSAPKAAVAAPVLDSNTFTISFQSSEPVAWSAISKLQNLPMAPVVTRVSFRNLNQSLQFIEGGGPGEGGNTGDPLAALFAVHAGKEPADNKPIDPLAARKLVAGAERVEAQVTFKVYQLPPSAKHSGK